MGTKERVQNGKNSVENSTLGSGFHPTCASVEDHNLFFLKTSDPLHWSTVQFEEKETFNDIHSSESKEKLQSSDWVWRGSRGMLNTVPQSDFYK